MTRALACQAAQKHGGRMDLRRRDADRHRVAGGRAADRQRDGGPDLAAEGIQRAKLAVARGDDFIADQQTRPMRWRALHDPGDKGSSLIVYLSEHADSRIGDLACRENSLQASTT